MLPLCHLRLMRHKHSRIRVLFQKKKKKSIHIHTHTLTEQSAPELRPMILAAELKNHLQISLWLRFRSHCAAELIQRRYMENTHKHHTPTINTPSPPQTAEFHSSRCLTCIQEHDCIWFHSPLSSSFQETIPLKVASPKPRLSFTQCKGYYALLLLEGG